MNRFSRSVRTLLMRHWDPIGVTGIAAARDEYDGYVPGLVAMLRSGAPAEALERRLVDIERTAMGLPGDPARARDVAGRLRALQTEEP